MPEGNSFHEEKEVLGRKDLPAREKVTCQGPEAEGGGEVMEKSMPGRFCDPSSEI